MVAVVVAEAMVVDSRTTAHTPTDLLITTVAEVTVVAIVAAVEAIAAATEEDIRAVMEEDIKAVEAETGSPTTRTTIARSGMTSCLEMGRSVR
jgi:hypothetical protein